jgi:hypothetical protein
MMLHYVIDATMALIVFVTLRREENRENKRLKLRLLHQFGVCDTGTLDGLRRVIDASLPVGASRKKALEELLRDES